MTHEGQDTDAILAVLDFSSLAQVGKFKFLKKVAPHAINDMMAMYLSQFCNTWCYEPSPGQFKGKMTLIRGRTTQNNSSMPGDYALAQVGSGFPIIPTTILHANILHVCYTMHHKSDNVNWCCVFLTKHCTLIFSPLPFNHMYIYILYFFFKTKCSPI